MRLITTLFVITLLSVVSCSTKRVAHCEVPPEWMLEPMKEPLPLEPDRGERMSQQAGDEQWVSDATEWRLCRKRVKQFIDWFE